MTTPTGQQEPWTDQRLEAAFATRASRIGTPDDVAHVAVDRVRAMGGPEPASRRLLGAAVAVALAVGIVGVVAVSGDRRAGPSPSNPEAISTDTPKQSAGLAAEPSDQPPTEIMGLPVMTVDEAIAIRDAGRDDREIAVRGWFHRNLAIRCAAPTVPVDNPLDDWCISQFLTSEPIVPADVPVPRIDVDFDEIEQRWAVSTEPVEIVTVGHFDDRRAGWCHPTRIEECRNRFVLDRVARAAGSNVPVSVATDAVDGEPPFDPVRRAVAAASPEGQILSASAYSPAALAEVEPSLREERPGITDEAVVWSVRVLEGDRAITYLVVDRTERVYQLAADGRAVQVGGEPPGTGGKWPPEGVVDVPMPVASTGFTPKAGIEDRTGLLVDARAAGEGDPPRPVLVDQETGSMVIVQVAPDALVVYWNSTLCDDRFVVTLYGGRRSEAADRLELRGQRASRCRLALISHGVHLRFSRPIDARAVVAADHVGRPYEAFPPVAATVVGLPNDGGFALPRVRAALVDLSGRITSVRLPRRDEFQPMDGLGSGGRLVPDPSVPGRYQLAWMGGPCAPDIVIRIDPTLEHVVVTNTVPPDPPDCDTVAQLYRLILDIDGPVDPPAVEVRHADMSAGAS